VRKKFNDWDFSKEGRIRQSLRMLEFAMKCKGEYVICDFVAPLPEMRHNFKADWTVWMDTIDAGRYEDTNKTFISPDLYDFRINEKNAEKWVPYVGEMIINGQRRPTFNTKLPTAQLLGRYQPWHAGHRALFEEALNRVGQVAVMVRDCNGWNNSNPFNFEQVSNFIKRDLDSLYQGKYIIILVPNITNIYYGRDVGYNIEKIELSEELKNISATKIRQTMGYKYNIL
jgi:phosphopantetheine adenylyltransferase